MIAEESLSGVFSVTVFITGKIASDESANTYTVHQRPDIDAEIDALTGFGQDAVVFACGPFSLVQDCAEKTVTVGVDFKQEVFLF